MKRLALTMCVPAWIGLCLLLLAEPAQAAACTAATDKCSELLPVAGGPARLLVYRTHPLDVRNDAVVRGLVVIHGLGRDAHSYFRHGVAGAFLAGALEDTVVVSLRFASNSGGPSRDAVAPSELTWQCQPRNDTWRTGGAAADNAQVTSFDAADEVLRALARKGVFPNLKAIIMAGHSAGGQFVSRYAMANQTHEQLGVPVMYVVANPSSYAYLDATRPTASAIPANVAAGAPWYTAVAPATPLAPFVPYPDAQNCSGYDSWPYGLRGRNGYSAKLPDDQLKTQLAGRPVFYLLGELDILPLYGFDSSCAAMAQGPTRLARGLAYARYVTDTLRGPQHKAVVVPACGHNGRCMFTAEVALPLLFPKNGP